MPASVGEQILDTVGYVVIFRLIFVSNIIISDAAAVRQIVIYTSALLPVSLLPGLEGMVGSVYLSVALVGGLAFLGLAMLGLRRTTRSKTGWSKGLFFYSILYLTVLFLSLVLDSGGLS
jgi:protoheme IX farnesyltransferase